LPLPPINITSSTQLQHSYFGFLQIV